MQAEERVERCQLDSDRGNTIFTSPEKGRCGLFFTIINHDHKRVPPRAVGRSFFIKEAIIEPLGECHYNYQYMETIVFFNVII